MASFLRQVVAGPRAKHPEAGLDLCYVTDNIIATSGPSQTYPQRAYRNPLDRLVAFLDAKHGTNWAIWEFRAEGTGYPDDLVYHRVRHYPWPDHHPPPFRLVPMIIASMKSWLEGNDLHTGAGTAVGAPEKPGDQLTEDDAKKTTSDRVIVVHCKAGKGRSGTMACSYLIAECGWTPADALARFTERRMRPQFGPGVSIPSQLRWVSYVDRWANAGGRRYAERDLEIVEVHVWGLRNGVKLAVEGYVDEGKKIHTFHTYSKKERTVVEGGAPGGAGMMDMIYDMYSPTSPRNDSVASTTADSQNEQDTGKPSGSQGETTAASPTTPSTTGGGGKKLAKRTSTLISKVARSPSKMSPRSGSPAQAANSDSPVSPASASQTGAVDDAEPGGMAVVFKSDQPIRVPNNDVNISLERRHRSPGAAMGLTMVTAVAHVWFNTWFEGGGPEKNGEPDDTGVFSIDWDKMDGIKGSGQRGTKGADRIAVVWRRVAPEGEKNTTGKKEETKTPSNLEDQGPDTRKDANKAAATTESTSTATGVPEMKAADWKGESDQLGGTSATHEKHLGLRRKSPDSADVSQASSIKGQDTATTGGNTVLGTGESHDEESMKGVKSDVGAE